MHHSNTTRYNKRRKAIGLVVKQLTEARRRYTMSNGSISPYERTGAEFRAIREKLGWSQREIAGELGEDHTTVKKWENPSTVAYGWKIRPYVWEWLDKRVVEFENEVDEKIDQALEYFKYSGADSITILYRRIGMYHSMKVKTRGHKHACPVGVANAVARTVGDYLVSEGYNVRYDWPEDDRDTRFFAHDGKF